MNIEAEIRWIQAELEAVKDPHLIEAFKDLLKYRNSKGMLSDSFYSTTIDDLKRRAEESLKAIEKGETRPIEKFWEDLESWKNKRNT